MGNRGWDGTCWGRTHTGSGIGAGMDPSDVGGLAEDWRSRMRLGKRKAARMGPSDARGLAEDWWDRTLVGAENGGWNKTWRE